MARYSVGFTKTTGAAAGLIAQLRTPAADCRVLEIIVTASSAASGTVALVRSTGVGATFTSLVPVAEDPKSGASTCLLDTVAGTAPTLATVPLRRITLPATVGGGVDWAWTDSRGIIIPPSSSLVLWQFSALAVTYDATVIYDE